MPMTAGGMRLRPVQLRAQLPLNCPVRANQVPALCRRRRRGNAKRDTWRAAQASFLLRGYQGHGWYRLRGKYRGHGAIMMYMKICTHMSTFT